MKDRFVRKREDKKREKSKVVNKINTLEFVQHWIAWALLAVLGNDNGVSVKDAWKGDACSVSFGLFNTTGHSVEQCGILFNW